MLTKFEFLTFQWHLFSLLETQLKFLILAWLLFSNCCMVGLTASMPYHIAMFYKLKAIVAPLVKTPADIRPQYFSPSYCVCARESENLIPYNWLWKCTIGSIYDVFFNDTKWNSMPVNVMHSSHRRIKELILSALFQNGNEIDLFCQYGWSSL